MDNKQTAHEENELKRVLGLGDLMGIGVGQIIGSGIMALTGITIAITGAGTPLAFIVAAILVICPNLVLAVLGSAVPATGGMYTYVRDYIGPKTGFFYLSLLVAGQLVLAMFAITFAEYACGLVPGLSKTLVAFGILTLCFIMNVLGVDMAAKLQNVLVIILAAAMVLFIAFGLPKVNWSVFSGGIKTIMPNGFVGFMTGASLLTFATGGAEFLSELGGEMKNPGRDLPRAMIYSTVAVAILYAFIGIVAVGVLPIEQVADETLMPVAQAIFPKALYYFFIVGGGMFAVASTLNATFTWCTKGLLVACEEGWLPKQAGAISKRGTPWVLLIVFYIVGAIPILTGLDISTIARLGNGVSLIYVLFPIATGYLIHKKNPEAMAKSTFKMGRTALYILTTVALIGYIIAAILNFSDIAGAWQMMLIYSAIVIIYAFIRERMMKKSK
ncbi:MAG: amino acid permease [Oscillospiraceae bacterium]|nr:amino acid permease [Oscillospiraceae bacterium]